MERAHQIEFCKKCLNREMDKSQGLICSLTNKKADFEEICPDYREDAKEAESIEEIARKEFETEKSKSGSFSLWIGIFLIIRALMKFSKNNGEFSSIALLMGIIGVISLIVYFTQKK